MPRKYKEVILKGSFREFSTRLINNLNLKYVLNMLSKLYFNFNK